MPPCPASEALPQGLAVLSITTLDIGRALALPGDTTKTFCFLCFDRPFF